MVPSLSLSLSFPLFPLTNTLTTSIYSPCSLYYTSLMTASRKNSEYVFNVVSSPAVNS